MSDNSLLSPRVAMEIKVLLTRRNMSGRQLAAKLDVSQTWMSDRLSGKTPIDLNDLQRIATVLNVEAADLLPRSDEGRVLKPAGRHPEDQGERIKISQSPLAKRPRLTGQGPHEQSSPSLMRTARKRVAATHNAPHRPMHGR